MKEGFDAPPVGIRLTKRDSAVMKRLARTLYPGLHLSMSEVARIMMRRGFEAHGFIITPDEEDDRPPVDPGSEELPPGVEYRPRVGGGKKK